MSSKGTQATHCNDPLLCFLPTFPKLSLRRLTGDTTAALDVPKTRSSEVMLWVEVAYSAQRCGSRW